MNEYMEIEVDSLREYENNPRNNEGAVGAVADSIDRFGFLCPIVVDDDGVILAGHTRLKAAKRLGLEKVPVVKASGLSEEQRRAFRLADNKTGELATWDMEALAVELDAIEMDLTSFGFEAVELGELPPGEYEDVEETDVPEAAPTRCREGDLWRLGDHVLMCGDSTEALDVERLMGGERAALWLTDPPYNVAYEGRTEEALRIDNDDMSDAQFSAFLADAFREAERVMEPGAAFYVWHASRTQRAFEEALNGAGLSVRQQLVWAKNIFVLGRQDYQWRHELAFYGWKDGAAHTWHSDRSQTTVLEEACEADPESMKKAELAAYCRRLLDAVREFKETVLRFDKPARNAEHPTMKPVKLMAYLVQNSSERGDAVLDSFAGSGSTLMACEQLGRRCYAMELDPRYCDVIVERWEKFTGREAVKVSSVSA